MNEASEAIYALKPVSFRYHKQYDATQTIAFGLIAEEVAEVSPDLVSCNLDGEPESVRYEQINAMLLNKFRKVHRKVQKLQAALEAVSERLKEQDARIRKVITQVQLSNSAMVWLPRTREIATLVTVLVSSTGQKWAGVDTNASTRGIMRSRSAAASLVVNRYPYRSYNRNRHESNADGRDSPTLIPVD
jgi:Chaperone of endosialidase